MFTPLQIVTSSLISRDKPDINLHENVIHRERTVNESNSLENLDYQAELSKIKNDVNNKLKMNNKFLNKKKNFDNNISNVKKRCETETRIYQTSSLMGNSRDEKLQMTSADKYLTTIQKIKEGKNGQNAVNKHSLHNRNWIIGQIATKKDNDDLNDSINNKIFKGNCVLNKEEIYNFPPMASEEKKEKYKKRTCIDEFIEFKDKCKVFKKPKQIENEDYSSSFLIKNPSKRDEIISEKIITPFKNLKTSFFNDVDNPSTSELVKFKKGSRGKKEKDFAAEWIRGRANKRERNIANNFDDESVSMKIQGEDERFIDFNNYCLSNEKSRENKRSFTSFDEETRNSNHSQINNPTMTISNSLQYTREIVIRKTKVSKVNFPPHIFN
ncbi:uncharacterized protein MCAP_0864-like [Leptopilina heterotoma]|uniref:uncharacterized protein MCAP_0864-like n=1 Tax=Leptopilina heterotoma TaxID=63436 RepID=UPI001CA9EA97|nr:uncharacterized protein MCAP_0864-like [Leptopilina heterotoma]